MPWIIYCQQKRITWLVKVVMELSILWLRSIFLAQNIKYFCPDQHQIKTLQLLMLELAWHLLQSPYRDPTCKNLSFAFRLSGNAQDCTLYLAGWSEVKNRTWEHAVLSTPIFNQKWLNWPPREERPHTQHVGLNECVAKNVHDLSFFQVRRGKHMAQAHGPAHAGPSLLCWRNCTPQFQQFFCVSIVCKPIVLCNLLFCEDLYQLPSFCVCF